MLQKFVGLRNTVDAERLTAEELERAINIDLDDAGQIHSRRGFTLKDGSPSGSLFQCADGTILMVKNGVLGTLSPGYAFFGIDSSVGTNKLVYTQVGRNVYYSSVGCSGVVNLDTLTVQPWGQVASQPQWLSPVVDPTSTLFPIRGKLLGAPPMASDLTYYNGRIYLAAGNLLWATELYLYNYVDRTKTFLQFESRITAIGAVADGIYVGTENDLWWLGGDTFPLPRKRIYPYGIYSGSMVLVPRDAIDPQVPPGQVGEAGVALAFMTMNGLCAGLNGGQMFAITNNKFWFPNVQSMASLFRRQDGVQTYVGVMDSQGTPASAARIGDYVSAEIIRFKGE